MIANVPGNMNGFQYIGLDFSDLQSGQAEHPLSAFFNLEDCSSREKVSNKLRVSEGMRNTLTNEDIQIIKDVCDYLDSNRFRNNNGTMEPYALNSIINDDRVIFNLVSVENDVIGIEAVLNENATAITNPRVQFEKLGLEFYVKYDAINNVAVEHYSNFYLNVMVGVMSKFRDKIEKRNAAEFRASVKEKSAIEKVKFNNQMAADKQRANLELLFTLFPYINEETEQNLRNLLEYSFTDEFKDLAPEEMCKYLKDILEVFMNDQFDYCNLPKIQEITNDPQMICGLYRDPNFLAESGKIYLRMYHLWAWYNSIPESVRNKPEHYYENGQPDLKSTMSCKVFGKLEKELALDKAVLIGQISKEESDNLKAKVLNDVKKRNKVFKKLHIVSLPITTITTQEKAAERNGQQLDDRIISDFDKNENRFRRPIYNEFCPELYEFLSNFDYEKRHENSIHIISD